MILIFDTETTGLADFGAAARLSDQPDLVELGLIWVTNSLEVVTAWSSVVNGSLPSTTKAFEAHGISEELRKENGITRIAAVENLRGYLSIADYIVGHNLAFDRIVMDAAAQREATSLPWDDPKRLCTMHISTDILKLPGKFKGHKWPTLMEAYTYFTGRPLEGAHRALTDCFGCLEVLRHLVKEGHVSIRNDDHDEGSAA